MQILIEGVISQLKLTDKNCALQSNKEKHVAKILILVIFKVPVPTYLPTDHCRSYLHFLWVFADVLLVKIGLKMANTYMTKILKKIKKFCKVT